MSKHPDESVGTLSIIGQVIRALRIARGVGVNQLGNSVGLEPANLSRFERGRPGGVHAAKYLDAIATRLGTKASILYAIAEFALDNPAILKKSEDLSVMVDQLTCVIKHYSNLPSNVRDQINQVIRDNLK
ncbi:MAG TPA: helix-turn-helix transcriptional regulator [Gammaproteobacteria bacterium]